MRTRFFQLLLALQVLFLAACGGADSVQTQQEPEGGPVVGDAGHGERLYNQTVIGAGSAPGCVTCHSLSEGVVLAGPSHAGLGQRAENAVSDTSAKEYLLESILEPDAHVVEGFTSGSMYAHYAKELSEQQIADLVAFMLTLR